MNQQVFKNSVVFQQTQETVGTWQVHRGTTLVAEFYEKPAADLFFAIVSRARTDPAATEKETR